MRERIDAALREAIRLLGSTDVDEARSDAYVLMARVLGRDRSWLLAHGEVELTAAHAASFRALTHRRAAGEPVAYLTGEREFWSLMFQVDRRVLVPRPESEHLVETVLEKCSVPAPLVVDVGTGSGCLGLAVAHERPEARILAVDISRDALAVARANARRLGLDDRFAVVHASGLSAVAAGVDVVMANPPYVSEAEWAALPRHVREHEPPGALTCGADDLAMTREIIREGVRVLRPGGLLAVEIAPQRAADVAVALSGPAWSRRGIRPDLAGRSRVAWGERGGAA